MSKTAGKIANVLQELKAHNSDVTCVEFWGNVLLVTGSSDKTIRIWKWVLGEGFVEESFSPLLGHKYGVTSVKISPQGGVLASSSVDGTTILWDISNGTKTDTLFQENCEAVRCCCFSPDGSAIATADDSGTICLWGQNKNLIKILRFHEETVYTVAFSHDSSVLLSGCNLGNLKLTLVDTLVENQNDEPNCSIDNAHDLGVLYADFCKLIHRDPASYETTIHTVATCGNDHNIKIWRIYCLSNSKETSSTSRLVPTSPNEHVSGNSTIYNTNVMNAECVLVLSCHGCSVTCVKFNNRGTILVSSGMDKTIKIWDLQGNCLQTLNHHTRYVNCIAINTDSTIIASGSNDRTVILWDLTSSLTLDSHIAGLRSIVFNLASSQNDIPLELICPITHEIMTNPVIASDGFTYERSAIVEWFDRGKLTSPMTNEEITTMEIVENTELKASINEFLKSLDFDTFDGSDDPQ